MPCPHARRYLISELRSVTSELRSVAVVDVGPIGQQHAEVWNEHPQCRVTLVCDLNAERAQTVAANLVYCWPSEPCLPAPRR
jgi:hypothetical protein